jgi:hypothetical protein
VRHEPVGLGHQHGEYLGYALLDWLAVHRAHLPLGLSVEAFRQVVDEAQGEGPDLVV